MLTPSIVPHPPVTGCSWASLRVLKARPRGWPAPHRATLATPVALFFGLRTS
ncbi:hypothetical protein [Subtercola lobariae]|uniref:hypothetical protein n=1 Tax=Subtercola lobariae TaxID=1588641 RepID=UPI001E4922FF|nr:hypothetical protein [Subtercola lobariae]